MFNNSSFNKASFNIGNEGESDIKLVATMTGTFNAMVATGGNLYVEATANESFHGKADLAAGELLEETSMHGDMNADAALIVEYGLSADLVDSIAASAACSEDIYLHADCSDMLQAYAYLSFDEYLSQVFTGVMESDAFLSLDYYQYPIVMSAIMDAQVTSIQFDVDYVTIDMTLEPGQALVIDSDNFVVLHDGNDAIETHSGIWPMLAREVFDIQVSSGAVSDLVTSILYTDRYL